MSIQFNAKSGSNFRKVAAKYHVACHTLNDTINRLQDSLKNYKGILKTDVDNLEALKKGGEEAQGVGRTEEEIKASAGLALANIKRLEDDLKAAREKASKSMEAFEKLVSEDLYKAYVEYVSGKGEGDEQAYAEAISVWFKGEGFEDATADNCKGFVGLVGLRKNSSRTSYKEGMLMAAETKKVFVGKFLRALVDNLQAAGIITPHKYTFVLPSKKNQ